MALGLIALTTLAYLNSFRAELLFDDDSSLLHNPGLHSLVASLQPPADGGLTVAGRPLLSLSFALNYAVGGYAWGGYRAVNLALHLANGLLLAAIVRRLLAVPTLAPRWAVHASAVAATAAALWLLHPLQTESVTYLVQRAESLVTLFYLGTIAAFLRAAAEPTQRRWAVLTVFACATGMASKEVMATAPLVLLGLDRLFLAGSWREVWRRRAALHIACAATWVLLGALVLSTSGRGGTAGFGTAIAPLDYALTQFFAIAHYLRLTFWPSPLVLDYGTTLVTAPAQVIPAAALVLGLLAAALWALRRGHAWGAAVLFFFVVLAPSSSVIPVATQTMAEHRTYLPLAGLCVLAAGCAVTWLGRAALPVALGVALVCGGLTWQRNEDYRSRIRLFEELVALRPDNARAMALLADYQQRAGNLAAAQRWLERSVAIEPAAEARNNLGNVLLARGDVAGARAQFELAVAAKPNDATTLANLGNALAAEGRVAEALARLTAAVQAAPQRSALRFNLANILAQAGRPAEAEKEFRAALALAPDDVEARANLAGLLAQLGRGEEAFAEMRDAVRRAPNHALLHAAAGSLFEALGRSSEAAEAFATASRLAPDNVEFRRAAERTAAFRK